MRSCSLLLPLLFLTPGLSGQKTWIVDANQGAGFHFKDLPKAVQSAKDGDILLVRKGIYHSFQLNKKGLRILGTQGTIVETTGKATPIQIQNLGQRSQVLLKGLQLKGPSNLSIRRATLDITACKGLVLVEECRIQEPTFLALSAVSVNSSSQVVFNHCLIRQQIRASQSQLVVTASLVYGKPPAEGFGVTGIRITGGSLELSQSIIVPGLVVSHTPTPYGIETKNARVRIRGNTSSLILGGLIQGLNQRIPAFVDLRGNGGGNSGTSTLLIDPEVRYSGTLNTFGKRARVAALSTVTARSTRLGGNIMGELHPAPKSSFVLWSALPGPRLTTPIGDLWLDLPSLHPQIAGFAKDRSDKPFRLPIPNLTQLLAVPLAFQALTWNTKGFQLSNAALTTIGQ